MCQHPIAFRHRQVAGNWPNFISKFNRSPQYLRNVLYFDARAALWLVQLGFYSSEMMINAPSSSSAQSSLLSWVGRLVVVQTAFYSPVALRDLCEEKETTTISFNEF